jgi:hypothetical protein
MRAVASPIVGDGAALHDERSDDVINSNGSRPDAKAYPTLARVAMTLLDTEDQEFAFTLASPRPGLVDAGPPPRIRLGGIRQPVLILFELTGTFAEESGARFPPDPHDAAWFGPGETLPQNPGTAAGMFRPLAVSADGKELLVFAMNAGDGGTYRARFQFGSTLSAAAKSGGPIIIND